MGANGSKVVDTRVPRLQARREAVAAAFAANAAAGPAVEALKAALAASGGSVLTIADCPAAFKVGTVAEGRQAGVVDYVAWVGRVFNKDAIALPAIIARVRNEADVVAAVACANATGLPLCVASGAHSIRAFVDGACVVDCCEFTRCVVDPATKTIAVQSGALLSHLDAELSKHKLVVVCGTNPHTGMAGLTLSGGFGWFSRRFGLTIDALESVEAVLASGERVTATDTNEHADLLWACRGGGGNVAVITTFTFRCETIPHGGRILQGTVVGMTPTAHAKQKALRKFFTTLQALDDMTMGICVLPCGAPVMPTMWAHTGPRTLEGPSAVPEVEQIHNGLGGWFHAQKKWELVDYYTGLQGALVEHQKEGYWYLSIMSFNEVVPGLTDTIVHFATEDIPNKLSAVLIMPMLGKAQEFDASKGYPRAKFWVLVEGKWDPDTTGDAGRDAVVTWAKRFQDAMAVVVPPAAPTGHALSDKADGEPAVKPPRSPWWQKHDLVATRYDPKGLFVANREKATAAPAASTA